MIANTWHMLSIAVILLKITRFCFSEPNNLYKIYYIESDKVCSQNSPLIRRISTSLNGLILKETTYFDNWLGKNAFKCHFEVETGFKSQLPGIFAVIQNLHLRMDPETGNCIDYIKFRPAKNYIFSEIANINILKNSIPWTIYCGDLRARRDGDKIDESKKLAVTGFLSEHHIMEVEIFLDKKPLVNESLELEVIFTPYMTVCGNGGWSEYKECGQNKCIKKQSFNDGYVNCPFLACPDEDGCDVIENELPDLQAKVMLTAVTSIFCSFFLFLGCIWCCRYFELLCWSANNLLGRPNPLELSPMAEPSPSAPPPDSSNSKDLPPAYETLFPDRFHQCLDLEYKQIMEMIKNYENSF